MYVGIIDYFHYDEKTGDLIMRYNANYGNKNFFLEQKGKRIGIHVLPQKN